MDGAAIHFVIEGKNMYIELLSKKNEAQVMKVFETYKMNVPLYENGSIFLCAMENNIVYGFVKLYKLREIKLIYAMPSSRQVEIFQVLLAAVDRIGYDRLILHTSKANEPFFASFGYSRSNPGTMVKILPLSHHFNTYEDVQDFINAQKDRVYSLEHFKEFAREHFNIQYVLKCVHIGGTNGKGSTVNYTKEVLKQAHYEVGTFTSPSLDERLDIIQINDEPIDEKTFVHMANRFMGDFLEAKLSKFEIEVFISILYFIFKGVDIALYEVGLGGTLDATNIIGPILAVNTNIGLDHTDYLGDTYESIARNKAGIIKDGVPYMTAETRADVLDVFYEEAKKHNSELVLIDPVEDPVYTKDQITYDYHGYHITLNTGARYQVTNSALAINILETIRPLFPFTTDDLVEGLKKAHWAARFETVHEHPLVIIDGAHNKEGMEKFVQSASIYEHPHIIFSALGDKDTHNMLSSLLSMTDDITVTQFTHPRAATAKELAEDLPVKINTDWKACVDEALTLKDRTIFITGSLYFLAQVRKYIKNK
jgi:dihydrofolate synthase/folylpolyglutamate synthase